MTKQNTRRGDTQSRHAEFISASSRYDNNQLLNQVQDDNIDKTALGFTLIELLVVVLIIGILAAVAVPQYQKAVTKSRAVNTLALLVKFSKDQEIFYLTNGTYANTWEQLGTDTPVDTFEEDGRAFYFQGNKYILSRGGAEVWVQMYPRVVGTLEIHVYGTYASGGYAGKRSCHAFTKRGEEICQSWGGEEFERTTSWVKYWIH